MHTEYFSVWLNFTPLKHPSYMKHLIPKIFVAISLAGSISAQAQNVGIGTNTPDNSALLHLESTTMGFLPPRMTYAQRDAIVNPAHGLVVFITEDSTLQFWNGACWLKSFQEDCNSCYFSVNPATPVDTIDRTITDSCSALLSITQTNGLPQNIIFNVASVLPPGMTVNVTPNPLMSTGQVTLTVHVTPFTPEGLHTIVIQAFCGQYLQTIVYAVYVEPCYLLDVFNSTLNYDVASALYATYPTAPVNQPVCVHVTVHPGVEITSNTTALPAFTTGNLPAGSVVGITNNGNIIGRGGNGGTAWSPTSGTTGEGFPGGTAINLTVNTNIQNNFNIFGGGGGGNAMAFEISWTPPAPANIVTLGIFVGGGGGGGAGNGQGGQAPGSVIGLSYYVNGLNGTGGQFGVGGQGGILNFPIPVNLGPVTISLSPNAVGGNGGGYGYPGTQGYFNLLVSASITINIPFLGTVTIPVVNNVPIPLPVPPPPPGAGGYAIKRNGNTVNIPDNFYTNANLRGQVGN